MHSAIHLRILQDIVSWAEDQAEHPNTSEVRLNFATGEMEVYDYESRIVYSTRPLPLFCITDVVNWNI